jgi:putative ABC transport system permease protein
MRYAFRTLAKSPGFTVVAILAIALGVGPNSAVFSIIHSVLLQPLPIPAADRVVILWETNKARNNEQLAVSGRDLLDWRAEARLFDGFVTGQASPDFGFNLTAPGGAPERVLAGKVGVDFTDLMGLKPVIGRGFLPTEGEPGSAHAVLLSYQLWKRRFGGDPGITGKAIGLDGVSYNVTGVLPADLRSVGSVDVWLASNDDMAHAPRAERRYGAFGRLKPGVTLAQAKAEMDAIQERLASRYADSNANVGVSLTPLAGILSSVRPAFLMLAAAVAFLLTIACANVAGLLLARGAVKQKEIAIRVALGASRGRIVGQVLGESLILAVAGGVVGLAMAAVSLRLLRNALPDVIPRLREMSVDATVLGFTIAASLLTGVIFGILPAIRMARTSVNSMLNDGGGKGTPAGGSQRARSLLLVGEVALALILLAGAGLLMRSFFKLSSIDPGFRPDHLLTMRLSLPDTQYDTAVKRANFTRNVLRRASATPGVRSASTINTLPMRSYFITLPARAYPYQFEGEAQAPAAERPVADIRAVGTDFLTTMGVRLVRGRDFTTHDDRDARGVAIVNESLARRAGFDVLGRRVRLGANEVREIVGIVPDVRLYNLDGAVRPAIFVPYEQLPGPIYTLLIRTAGDPMSVAGALRHEILQEDPTQAVADVQTMEQVVSDSLLLRRLSMSMLAVFAGLALLLAAVGIYGLTAYSVSRRTREIGLRMALGADRGNILRLVVGRGLAIAATGVALGIPGALGIARLMRGMLYGIGPSDPLVFAGVAGLLIAIAAVASYVPARRAVRVDPVVALKYE